MFASESRHIAPGKKVYFASDFHLGIDGKYTSKQRELFIIEWLTSIEKDAEIIFLVGDIFDFWFEYKKVVPKGYVRLLGKIASLRDQGIEIIVYTGNHDMWMFDYLQQELGVALYKQPVLWQINGISLLVGHGDGLGPGDHGYKLIKAIFNHPVCQWLFARIHPNTGIRLMQFFSGKSREQNSEEGWNEKREWLVLFCEEILLKKSVDYFVFGHRHLVIDHKLSNQKSRYLNIGDWFQFFSFACFDGKNMDIRFFRDDDTTLISNHLTEYAG